MSGKEYKNQIASVRGGTGRGNSVSAKAAKRGAEMMSPASPENQVTLSSIRILFREEFEPITAELDELKRSVEFNSSKLEEITALNSKVDSLEKKCDQLSEKLDIAVARCEQLEEKVVTLESFSRKNNLKFLGIKTADSNRPAREDCESIILGLCDQLGLSIGPREIERAHRLGPYSKAESPIIVKLSHFKDKQLILSKRKQFKDIGVTVIEDFPVEVQARRKIFGPVIQAAYRSGTYKAKLIGDKLLLNGRQYSSTDINKLPDDLKPDQLCTPTNGDKVAFFTLNSKLSNHYRCSFTVNGLNFKSVEQYFMFCKAKEFGDKASFTAIMNAKDATSAKAIGARIKNFDSEVWMKVRDGHMRKGLMAKFNQNEELKSFLMGTGKKILIEGNPHDTYWAAGLHIHDKDIWNPLKWKGKNQLGTLLNEVRDNLK